MTELIFLRHGETDWNRQPRFQGQIDVTLNAMGELQAARLAARLGAEPPVDLFFSSDLLRARQTAAPLASAWQRTVQTLPALREQSFGVLEGLDVPTIKVQHPELWRHWLEHAADYALPGGESLRHFHQRVMAAVGELAEAHPGRRLAVMTHGGVLDMLWRSAHGLPLDGLRQCEIPNTGINRLRWRHGGVHGGVHGALEVEVWADAAHLDGLPPQPGTQAGEREQGP